MPSEPPDKPSNGNVVKLKRPPTKGTRKGNGVGVGDGWGGPAKGAGKDASALIPGAHTTSNIELKSARDADAAEYLKNHLMKLALTAPREGDQIQATFKLITILEGMPVARVITATTADLQRMTDDELRREMEILGVSTN